MKEPFVFDMIHGSPLKWSGGLKDWEHTSKGRKPVIKPLATRGREIISRSEVYPYPLKEDKHIEEISGGKAPVIILKPTPDLPNYSEHDYENSVYYRLNPEESQRVQELQDRIDDLKRDRGRLRKQLRELQSEEEEQGKGEGRSIRRYKCSSCDETSTENQWEQNGAVCPECNEGLLEDADPA